MRLNCLFVAVFCLYVLDVQGHAIYSGLSDTKTFQQSMFFHFEKFEPARHPNEKHREAWMNSREYISDIFEKIGLDVELQCFNTSVLLELGNEETVEGCNIIGTSRGALDKKLIVVGAQYDSSGTSENHGALRDNGAGISLLLEVARAFEESWRWKGWYRNYTTMFVAFDLNTKEQIPESNGHPGSYFFVNEWLLPKLQITRQPLEGSIILDSISTYNTEPNTQVLSADFSSVFPAAFDRIVEGDRTGDFLAVISPPKNESVKLLKDFSGHYRMDRMRRPYRLQEMVAASNELGSGSIFQRINHQASYHFWTSKPALPSILITDTGFDRTLPTGEQCQDESRDCNYIFANKERMEFLYSTYQALTYTLLDRQATFIGLVSSANSSLFSTGTSIFAVLVSMIIARMMINL